jgi:hypothetical protein
LLLLIIQLPTRAFSQGLNPPGELGVSPAEAEKCDEYLADDLDALVKAANKLSTRPDVMSTKVLPASNGHQVKPGTTSCSSSWDVLKNQLHMALAPAAYASFNKVVTPLARGFLPYVKDQGICNTCVGQVSAVTHRQSAVAAAAAVLVQLFQQCQHCQRYSVAPRSSVPSSLSLRDDGAAGICCSG